MVGCATNKKTPFLSGADGVVSDFQQKIGIAARAYKEATRPFTNHPGAARHPSLKTEGSGAVSEPTHSLPFKQRRMDLSSISKFLASAPHPLISQRLGQDCTRSCSDRHAKQFANEECRAGCDGADAQHTEAAEEKIPPCEKRNETADDEQRDRAHYSTCDKRRAAGRNEVRNDRNR